MGLDAFVPCNCLREGKTAEPPVQKEWIALDDDGYYSLKPEYAENEALNDQVDSWADHCCVHRGMRIDIHISNWSGLRSFQQALEKIGIVDFPILSAELPDTNGGFMSVESARKALHELDEFERKIATLSNYYLINTENGTVVYDYIDAYAGQFFFSSSYGIGFNENGLYIIDSKSSQILFQAKRVSQKVFLYPNWLQKAINCLGKIVKPIKKARWTDLDTNTYFDTPWVLNEGSEGNYYKMLAVDKRFVCPDEYQYITVALRTVFTASIRFGNSVYWT